MRQLWHTGRSRRKFLRNQNPAKDTCSTPGVPAGPGKNAAQGRERKFTGKGDDGTKKKNPAVLPSHNRPRSQTISPPFVWFFKRQKFRSHAMGRCRRSRRDARMVQAGSEEGDPFLLRTFFTGGKEIPVIIPDKPGWIRTGIKTTVPKKRDKGFCTRGKAYPQSRQDNG